MAGKTPPRTLKPTGGPAAVNVNKPRRPGRPASLPTLKGVVAGNGGGVNQMPGGGGGKGTPGAGYPARVSAGAAAQAAARLKASGGQPVGYGLKGTPFYNIDKYHQSKAFAQQKAKKAAQGFPAVPGSPPPPRQQPLAQGNRLPGVSPNFPHVGAPAASGTADQHFEAARAAVVRAQERGL